MAAPNESTFNATTRSPRFSTSKALGFAGGRTDPVTGNLQEPSFTQQAGINPTPQPAIAQFNSSMFPRPPGLGATLGTSALGAVAGEGAKQGIKALGGALGFGPPEASSIGPAAGTQFAAGLQPSGAETFPVTGTGAVGAAPLDAGTGAAIAPSGEATAAGLGEAGAVGAGAAGAADVGAAGAALIPSGEATGAALGAGAASGGSFLAGLGDFLGSVGGFFAALFEVVEETFRHVGINPNGPEHQMIQQFATQQAQETPEGQKFIQEYLQICPQLIAIINSMPDGEEIWRQNYQQFVAQAITALMNGDEHAAGQYLTDMIWFLVSAAEETQAGHGITLELNSLASLADKALIEGRSDSPVPGSPTGPGGVPMSKFAGYGGGVAGSGYGGDEDIDTDAMMAGGGMGPIGGRAQMGPGAPNAQQQQEPGQHMAAPMPGQKMFNTPTVPQQTDAIPQTYGTPDPASMEQPPQPPQQQQNPPIGMVFSKRY